MKKIYLLFYSIALFSCSSKIRYIGQKFPETKNVDVFISENSIHKNYELVGQGYPNIFGMYSRPDKLQHLAEKLARKKGVDAVIISRYYLPNTGQSINSVYRTDSLGKTAITTGNTTISPLSSSGYTILFAKYY